MSTGSGAFFRVRVGVLLAVLAFVVLWAWRDVRRRRGRTAWDRSLAVAIVLVRRTPLDPNAVAAFEERVEALDARLVEERRRYDPHALRPFMLTFVGPVDEERPPPKPAGETILDATRQAWDTWRWTSSVDARAGIVASQYDSRIYVSGRAPKDATHEMVEGESQQGGRVGTVEVELDASMADFALFVAAHELFHTLGATDKYDVAGRTLVPQGLAEPDRVPILPQTFAEVMAENRPVSPSLEGPSRIARRARRGPRDGRGDRVVPLSAAMSAASRPCKPPPGYETGSASTTGCGTDRRVRSAASFVALAAKLPRRRSPGLREKRGVAT